MKLRKEIPVILMLIAGIVFYGCTKDTPTCNQPLPDQVSFAVDVIPLFRSYCSTPACHSGGSPSGNLNLEDSLAYIKLSKPGSGYLNTNIPTHSVLYSSLISTTQPMPPTGQLDLCKIDLILKWIQQGAKNN